MKKMFKRIVDILLAAVLVTLAAVPFASAASEPRILEQKMTENLLTMYVRHTGGAVVEQVTIGNEQAEELKVFSNPHETTPTVTWILFDNSTSMPASVRAGAAELVMTLVGEKGSKESYNFCTFSDRLSVKLRNSSSYADIQTEVNKIEYYDQPTYLRGALDEVFTEEINRTGSEFVRIIVISDGGDTVTSGAVDDPLRRLPASSLHVSNIPIYTFGCNNGINDLTLPQMYSLSDSTFARYWNLGDVSASDIAHIMHWEELPVLVEASVPSRFLNGSRQEVRATFSDGTSAAESIITPTFFTQEPPVTEPAPLPEPEPEPVTEEVKSGVPAWVVVLPIALVLAVAAAAAVFFIIRKRSERAKIIPVYQSRTAQQKTGVSHTADRQRSGGRQNGHSGETDPIATKGAGYQGSGNSQTEPIVSGDTSRVLYLSDTKNGRQFSAPLRDAVTLGRSMDNDISIDYDGSVSGRHCEIYRDGSSCRIRDTGSTNGTFVDGNQVVNTAEISNGSVIRLGRVEFEVSIR